MSLLPLPPIFCLSTDLRFPFLQQFFSLLFLQPEICVHFLLLPPGSVSLFRLFPFLDLHPLFAFPFSESAPYLILFLFWIYIPFCLSLPWISVPFSPFPFSRSASPFRFSFLWICILSFSFPFLDLYPFLPFSSLDQCPLFAFPFF